MVEDLLKGKTVKIPNYSAMNHLRIKMKKLGKQIHQQSQLDGTYLVSLNSFRNPKDTLIKKTITLLTNTAAAMHDIKEVASEAKINSLIKHFKKQLVK